MTQISLPSHILQPHLKPGKGTHFAILPELPRIGHCRGFPPPDLCLFSCFFFILDLDECKDKTHQCDVNANCTNIPGLYNLRSGSIFVSLWKLHFGGQDETKREPDTNLLRNVCRPLFWLIDICRISQSGLLPLLVFLVCKFFLRGKNADWLT